MIKYNLEPQEVYYNEHKKRTLHYVLPLETFMQIDLQFHGVYLIGAFLSVMVGNIMDWKR